MNDLQPIAHLPSYGRLDEYFGLWAIEELRARSLWTAAAAMDLRLHARDTQPRRLAVDVTTVPGRSGGEAGDDVAIIRVNGVLMKQEMSLSDSTSYVALKREARRLARSDQVGGVLMIIDSPGGNVHGSTDAVEALRQLAERKHLWAFAEDLCASAGYRLALTADRIIANNRDCLVGSIGAWLGLYDYSKQAEKEGIKAKVYRSAPIKGAGFPGDPITDEMDKYFQGLVDDHQVTFDQEVAQGRGMTLEQVAEHRTGAAFPATEALDRGLIDAIDSFESTLADLVNTAAKPKAAPRGRTAGRSASQEEPTMSTNPTKPATGSTSPGTTAADAAKPGQAADTTPVNPGAAPLAPSATGDAGGGPGDRGGSPAPAAPPAPTTAASPSAEPAPTAPPAPKAATLAELKAALPNSDAAFREKCLEDGATLDAAKDRWIKACEARIDGLQDQAKKLQADCATLRGHDGVPFNPEATPQQKRAGSLATKLGARLGRFAAGIKLPRAETVTDN